MKIFANKSILKKLIIIFIVIAVVSFVIPKVVKAADFDLIEGVVNLVVRVGDGVMRILHDLFLKQNMTLIRITASNGWVTWIRVSIILVTVVVAAIAIIATGGILAAPRNNSIIYSNCNSNSSKIYSRSNYYSSSTLLCGRSI